MSTSPVNPLRTLRERLRLGVQQAADAAGVSKQLIIRAEQAVYTEPPPALIRFYNPDVWDRESILHDYHLYQTATRQSNYGLLQEPPPVGDLIVGEHPLSWWRRLDGISMSRISTAFCVHPALVFKFERTPNLVKSLPTQLEDALLESGYSPKTLSWLASAYDQYRAYLRQGVQIRGSE